MRRKGNRSITDEYEVPSHVLVRKSLLNDTRERSGYGINPRISRRTREEDK